MTHNNPFGGIGRLEDEEYERFLISQTTAPIDSNMTAYSNHEHNTFRSFPRTSFMSYISHDHGHNGTFTYDAAVPVPSQQFAHFPQPDYPHPLVLSQYLLPSRPNIRTFEPFHGMAEPQVMISRGVNYTVSQSVPCSMDYQFSAAAYSPNLVSPTITSPSLSFMSSPEQYYPHPTWPRSILTPPLEENMSAMSDDLEEKECSYDKPYAQLIYDALMQAPGHRMLLRDIYEWFNRNSRKPRESGTNGWQNSIRHNLSMNHAFENDKNDPIANRGSRKANSVWVLTEDAVKNGVQSTTRYRKNNKNNSSKKNTGSKAPAIQRQRSGARGGRAAKRAAQQKRTGERLGNPDNNIQAELPASASFSFGEHGIPTYRDDWCSYSAGSPVTPEGDHLLTPPYNLPQSSQFEVGDAGEIKYEADPFLDEEDQLRIILSQADSDGVIRDLARY